MDSDSDSDGSHISATPPSSPQPKPRPAPSPKALLLSSTKFRTKLKPAGATVGKASRPIIRPKSCRKPKKPPPDSTPVELGPEKPPPPVQPPPKLPPPDTANLPFQIHRSTYSSQAFASTTNDSIGTFIPGDLRPSKFASFSKIQKKELNFESVEPDSFGTSSFSTSQSEAEACEANIAPQESETKVATSGNSAKILKRFPNLIGRDSCASLPVKKPKCVNEGNFVKLNINGSGRKYAFKGKRKKYGSYSTGRKFYRSKRKFKGKGQGEEGGVYDEEGLAMDFKQREENLNYDEVLIQEAVMSVRNEASDENLLRLLKVTYGYGSFRSGQLEAIKMLLSGKSTMLLLPTGAGKSLCYQLPSMVLEGITLVISPLVALMIDQLNQLPPALPGGLLCSSQTPEETSETLQSLQEGSIKVLFVSPERLLSSDFISIFSSSPLISLVVVDEAHCVSEWSHNFRPSYMRLRASLLRARLKAGCILAMTATATVKALHNVMQALDIPSTNLIQTTKLRNNLQMSISMSSNRLKDLMALIKSSPYSDVKSIIIYCKFQSETDIVCKYLRDNNISAKSYHSAIPAKDRRRTQELFCANKIRVVVATVAFGMGLDKQDIGAVIHYSLPESLEEYVQEIGRAGRDGRQSYCHLFFDDISYYKLRSLIHSDGVDEYAVNKFLCQVFSNGTGSFGKVYSIVKEAASRKFDMKEEVLLTILTHLELGEVKYLCLLPEMNVTCTLNFHQTSPALLAAKDIVIAAVMKKSEIKDGQYVFDIPTIANSIGLQPADLSNHLQSLKFKGEITYELKDQAYCFTVMDIPKDICSLAAQLTNWLSEVERCKVRKMDAMFNAAVAAVKGCDKVHGCNDYDHTPCLQRKILEYFESNDDIDVPNKMAQCSPFLRADIKVFLQSNSHAKFTPRAVARILHGLSSPAFTTAFWSKCHFWGRYMQTDFDVVMEAAKAELMGFVGKDSL
ncbi:ATP-dependent DNA helicase Q-like 5 [Ipomoea triloba]|uniref:ATP-dependent DNA helicase Q-like 5 n=1 Tax=Ipomoea triloba TaxID=35885 RepID=UPI00125DEEE1|nr:ATP-dependent DNA helicase Q-like 5 [Ipomoea triloba]